MTPRIRYLPSLLLAAVLFAAAPALHAQGSPAPQQDPVAEALFPPELVMQHQQRIGLTAQQRSAITGAVQQLQSRVVELQWQLQAESQRLVELLRASPVNEAAALAQADRVMSMEREIKHAHLQMLVRIKNTLTREQQAALQSLR